MFSDFEWVQVVVVLLLLLVSPVNEKELGHSLFPHYLGYLPTIATLLVDVLEELLHEDLEFIEDVGCHHDSFGVLLLVLAYLSEGDDFPELVLKVIQVVGLLHGLGGCLACLPGMLGEFHLLLVELLELLHGDELAELEQFELDLVVALLLLGHSEAVAVPALSTHELEQPGDEEWVVHGKQQFDVPHVARAAVTLLPASHAADSSLLRLHS